MVTNFDTSLLDILACPKTKQPLTYDPSTQTLVSEAAGLVDPIRDGVPVLLIEEATEISPQKAVTQKA